MRARAGGGPTTILGAAFVLLCGTGASAGSAPSGAASASWASGLYALPEPEVGAESRVHFSLASPFRPPLYGGWAPIEVTVRNDLSRPGSWSLAFVSECGEQRVRSQFSLSAAAHATQRAELSVPLCVAWRERWSTRLLLEIHGSDVGERPTQLWWEHPEIKEPAKSLAPHTAMSDRLAVRFWEPLSAALRDEHKLELIGTRVMPRALPRDPRHYASYDSLWLAAEEWASLPDTARQGLREWVATGGALFVVGGPDSVPRSGTSGAGSDEYPGYGSITSVPGADDARLLAAISERLAARVQRRSALGRHGWPLLTAIGDAAVPATLLLTFVSVYACVVGPLNLFLCHRAKRRRPLALYWSTPAIAGAASVLIVLVILLKDGLGGRGEREVATLLLPDQRISVVKQEQISRTGLLLGSGFELSEPALIYKYGDPGVAAWSVRTRLNWQEQRLSGDWFESRARQVHVLEAVRPTRARIARLPSGADETRASVRSTLPEELRILYYRDGDGRCWKGQGLATGQRAVLERVACKELLSFWAAATARYGAAFLDLEAQKDRRSFFYAEVARDAGAIATHGSIRWSTKHIVLGPVVGQE